MVRKLYSNKNITILATSHTDFCGLSSRSVGSLIHCVNSC